MDIDSCYIRTRIDRTDIDMGIHCIYIKKHKSALNTGYSSKTKYGTSRSVCILSTCCQEPATATTTPVEKEATAKAVAPAVVLPMAVGRKVEWMQWVLVADSWRIQQQPAPFAFAWLCASNPNNSTGYIELA